jgi:hypothetical protein
LIVFHGIPFSVKLKPTGMKNITGFIFVLVFSIAGFASNFTTPVAPRAEDMMVPLFGSDQKISLSRYLKLTAAEYKTLTGKKLKFKEKISLKIFQYQLKKTINKDGTVNIEKFTKQEDNIKKFNIGWFALGFFLGLIGVIIVLFIKDEKRKARIQWTLVGWGFSVLIVAILTLIASTKGY